VHSRTGASGVSSLSGLLQTYIHEKTMLAHEFEGAKGRTMIWRLMQAWTQWYSRKRAGLKHSTLRYTFAEETCGKHVDDKEIREGLKVLLVQRQLVSIGEVT
jgi:hypothetical protein